MAVVPADATEHAEIIRQLLFDAAKKAVLEAIGTSFSNLRRKGHLGNRFVVVSHVGMIGVSVESHFASTIVTFVAFFQFQDLAIGLQKMRIYFCSIGNQRFSKNAVTERPSF